MLAIDNFTVNTLSAVVPPVGCRCGPALNTGPRLHQKAPASMSLSSSRLEAGTFRRPPAKKQRRTDAVLLTERWEIALPSRHAAGTTL